MALVTRVVGKTMALVTRVVGKTMALVTRVVGKTMALVTRVVGKTMALVTRVVGKTMALVTRVVGKTMALVTRVVGKTMALVTGRVVEMSATGLKASLRMLSMPFRTTCMLGPAYGYFAEPTRSVLVVAPQYEDIAKDCCTDLRIMAIAFLMYSRVLQNFMKEKVEHWMDCVNKASKAAVKAPQWHIAL
eukprot:Em0021g963a